MYQKSYVLFDDTKRIINDMEKFLLYRHGFTFLQYAPDKMVKKEKKEKGWLDSWFGSSSDDEEEMVVDLSEETGMCAAKLVKKYVLASWVKSFNKHACEGMK